MQKGIIEAKGKLHKELHDLYCLSVIIMVIRSRRMRLLAHVVCMRDMRNAYRVLVVRPEDKWPLGDLGVDRRMTDIRKQNVRKSTGILLRIEPSGLLM
jgi:hypothetical protein